jgi:hypothetical protein
MARIDTNITEEISDFSVPQMYDDPYFALLTKDGKLHVVNYTVVDK